MKRIRISGKEFKILIEKKINNLQDGGKYEEYFYFINDLRRNDDMGNVIKSLADRFYISEREAKKIYNMWLHVKESRKLKSKKLTESISHKITVDGFKIDSPDLETKLNEVVDYIVGEYINKGSGDTKDQGRLATKIVESTLKTYLDKKYVNADDYQEFFGENGEDI